MVCTLTSEQQALLFKTIAAELLDMVKTKTPFNLKDYVRSIYDLIEDSGEATALTYAGLVPHNIKLMIGLDQGVDDLIEDSIPEIMKKAREFNDISNVASFIGLVKKAEPENTAQAVLDSENEKKAESEISNPLSSTVPVRANTPFSARPNSLFTTTGNSLEPGRSHSYDFIKHLVHEYDYKINSERTGYYLTLMNAEGVIRDKDIEHSGNINKGLTGGLVQVITDVDGNLLYFDNDYKIVSPEQGKLVFFRMRGGDNVFENAISTLQTYPELEHTLGLEYSQIVEMLHAQHKEVLAKQQHVKSSPRNKVVQTITDGRIGFPIKTGVLSPMSAGEDISDFPINVNVLRYTGKDGQVKKKQIYYFNDPEDYRSIQFVAGPVADDPTFLDDAVDILLGVNIANSEGEKDDINLTAIRKAFFKTFFGNNGNTLITNDGKIIIKYPNNRSVLDSSEESKAELKAALTTSTFNGRAHSLNISDKITDYAPFYKKEDGLYKLSFEGMTAKEYRKFILNHSLTESAINPETGYYIFENGYFEFITPPAEMLKITNKVAWHAEDVTTPSPDSTSSLLETTESVPTISDLEKEFDDLKGLQRPKFTSSDDIAEEFNKLSTQVEIFATPEQISAAKKWYESHPMSKYLPVNEMFDIINSNPQVVANWTRQAITLYRGSTYADVYHEAWHGFTQMFLSESERSDLYDHLRGFSGNFTDYTGKNIEFNKATNKQLEEYLAEDFRTYMLTGKMKKASKVKKSLFDRIIEFFKSLFGQNSNSDNLEESTVLQELYTKLKIGNIGPLNTVSEFTSLNRIETLDPNDVADDITFTDAKLILDSIDSYFSQYVDDVNKKSDRKYTSKILTNPVDRANAYNFVLNEFITKYLESMEKLKTLPVDTILYKREYHKFKVLKFAIKNFSKNSNLGQTVTTDDIYAAETEGKGVIAYHMQKSKYLSFEDKYLIEDLEEKNKDTRESYGSKSGNEVSMKELATSEVLYLVRSLFDYKNGKANKPIINELGFVNLLPFDIAWNRIQKIVEGKLTVDEMYDALVDRAATDASIAQLISKLGNPNMFSLNTGNLTESDFAQLNLWTNFKNAFGSKRIPLVQLTIDITTDDKNVIEAVEIKPGKAQTEFSKIGREWDNLFSQPGNDNKYIIKKAKLAKNQRFTSNILNIEAIVKDFSDNWYSRPAALLKAVGMDISNTPEVINEFSFSGSLRILPEVLMEKLIYIYNYNLKSEDPIVIKSVSELVDLNINNVNERGNYNKLLELESKFSEKYGSNMVSNSIGTAQYELSLRSTVSQQIDFINKAKNFAEVTADPRMNHLSPHRNPFIDSLMTIKELFDPVTGNKVETGTKAWGGKKVASIDLLNSSGVSLIFNGEVSTIGTTASEADDVTQTLHNFYNYVLYGVSEATRHADKATSYIYKVNFASDKRHFIPIDQFARYKKITDDINSLRGFIDFQKEINGTLGMRKSVNQLMKYLGAEVKRIKLLKDGDPAGNALVGKNTYKKVGSDFIMFEDILTTDTKNKIKEKYIIDDFYNQLKNGENPVSELYETIYNEIQDYLFNQVENFKEDIKEVSLLNNDIMMNSVRKIITDSPNTPSELKDKNLNEIQIAHIDEALMRGYVINSWLQAAEMTLLFYGDPALYNMGKEEFHKRNAGVAATGTIPRTDESMNRAVNMLPGSYAESQWFKQSAPKKIHNGVMTTAVLEDTNTSSVYLEDYIKASVKHEENRIGRKLTTEEKEEIASVYSAYAEMKEGDAQGWITFDSYRVLLTRLGKWSATQEMLYQRILKGEAISQALISKFFPVKKMQYWAPLYTESGLPVMAFHKFSLLPLVPNLIKDTNLEQLHNNLTMQGFDYAVFNSGSKTGTITKDGKPDKFYTDNTAEDRELDTSVKYTPNKIFLDYFKDQLETQEEFKGKTIFSTQLRKLIEEGLMEGGVPVNFRPDLPLDERIIKWDAQSEKQKLKNSNYRALLNYEANVNRLTDYKIKELIKESGIQLNEKGEMSNLSAEFLDFIKKELSKQELAEHEIDFIKHDPVTNDLVYDLSIHPSADKIERLLTSLVHRRLVKQKVTGESLIQVSGAGLEKAGFKFRKPTKEERKQYGTNGLAFYRKDPKTGKTLPMQVKIALQGEFKKLLKSPEVLKLAKEQSITSLEALNILIKSEEWLNDSNHRKMITITGVRIPVQGLNSMEFAEIAEFLPESAGNIVILPAEIVAKAGSDFDIDKLTFLFPSMVVTSSNVELVTHDETLVDSLDSNKKLLDELREEYEYEYERLYSELKIANTEGLDTDLRKEIFNAINKYKNEKVIIKEKIAEAKQFNRELLEGLYEELNSLKEHITNLYEMSNEVKQKVQDFHENILTPLKQEMDRVKIEIAKASSKGIENELISNIIDILSLEQNFVDLVTPNGTFLIDGLAKYYGPLVNKYNPLERKDGSIQKVIPGNRIFELRYNRYKQSSNNIGKKTLGLGAVDNTYNTIFSRVRAYMNPTATLGRTSKKLGSYRVNQTIMLDHNTIKVNGEDAISLAHLYDSNNQNRISTIISQMMNGWVDVAKDSWIFNIQGNIEVAPVLLFMVQAGVPIDQAVAFVSQPLVREYVKMQRLIRGTFAKTLGVAAQASNLYRIAAKEQILLSIPELQGVITKKDLDLYSQTRTINTKLIPRYLGTQRNKFTLKELNDNIINASNEVNEAGEYTPNVFDLSTFLHFLELEAMSAATTEVKLGVNFDTSKSKTLFAATQKLNRLLSIDSADRMKESIVSDILEKSPIASFNIQGFMINFIRPLFKLRSHPELDNFINDVIMPMDIEKILPGAFRDKEQMISAFRNDFTSYAFQSFLNEPSRFNEDGTYKNTQITADVVPVNSLSAGATVTEKDGKVILAVDKTQLLKDLKSGLVYSEKYWELKRQSPVDPSYFEDADSSIIRMKYMRFIYEREIQKYLLPFEDFKTLPIFQTRYTEAARNVKFTEGDTTQVHMNKVSYRAYNDYIRDLALLNVLNDKFIFKDRFHSYAKDIVDLDTLHPDLRSQYNILASLQYADHRTSKNLRFSELKLDELTVDLYHDELKRLANPLVQKVEDPIENRRISQLFSMFPFFAFLQNGQDTKGRYALMKVASSVKYAPMMNKVKDYAIKELETHESFLNTFLDKFIKQYSVSFTDPDTGDTSSMPKKRIKNYGNTRREEYSDYKFTNKIKDNIYTYSTGEYEPSYKSGKAKMTASNVLPVASFVSKIENLVSKNKDLVIVYDGLTVPWTPSLYSNYNGDYNSGIIQDVIAKKQSKVLNNTNTFNIGTKPKGYMNNASQLFYETTEEDINDMKAQIDLTIAKLIEIRDSGKKLVFNNNGYGQSLLGYGKSNVRTKANKLTDSFPAPQSFLYLSKRLYEEFGFTNPGWTNFNEAKALVTKDQIVTDEEVNEMINRCFNSTN